MDRGSGSPARRCSSGWRPPGVDVLRIGPGYFDGSGLTEAALRGGRFRAAESLDERVDAALDALRAAPRALVYLYWGDVDKVGHVHGCRVVAVGRRARARSTPRVAAWSPRLPHDAALHVTADHGMVDVPYAHGWTWRTSRS